MNWIDVLAIVPYYITLGIRIDGQQNEVETTGMTIRMAVLGIFIGVKISEV